MKWTFLFTLLLINSLTYAQSPAFVQIAVYLNEPLPDKQALYIRGNHGMMGNWEHGKVRLAKKEPQLWSGIFLLSKGDNISFILDGGTPQKNFPGIDTFNHSVTKDTTIEINLESTLKVSNRSIPSGQKHKLPGTVPNGLQDRLVTVRTPPGYEMDTNQYYPVLYMMDGQSLFVDQESPDGFAWHLDKTLDSLEHHKIIEPTILVAIDHVFSTRSVEFADTEIGQRHRDYLIHTLIPSIDRQFRTKKAANDRIIGGAVAGGFVSFLAAWEHPEIVSNVIALSPAVQIYENDIFPKLEEYEGPTKNLKIYIDHGEFELDEKITPGVMKLKEYFEENEYQYTLKYHPNTIPDGENMRDRIIPALQHFLSLK